MNHRKEEELSAKWVSQMLFPTPEERMASIERKASKMNSEAKVALKAALRETYKELIAEAMTKEEFWEKHGVRL